MLLIAAGLLAKSFLNLSRTELGFPSANLLTLRVNLTGPEYATAKSQERYYAQVLERVRQLPMVRAAAVSTDLPLTGDQSFQNIGFQVAGRVPLPMAQRPQANMTKASSEFFRTMGIPLRSGRLIEVPEKQTDEVVVNEAFARKILPGEDPLGKRIVFGRNDATQWTIVGVVGSIRANDLGAEPEPRMFRDIGQSGVSFFSPECACRCALRRPSGRPARGGGATLRRGSQPARYSMSRLWTSGWRTPWRRSASNCC